MLVFSFIYFLQMRAYYRAKIAKTKDAVEDKLRRQQVQFDKERAELVVLVNEECARIVQEVHILFQQQQQQPQGQTPQPQQQPHHAQQTSSQPPPQNNYQSSTRGVPESRDFAHATPPVVPPPPPSHHDYDSTRPTPPTHREQGRDVHAHFSEERHQHEHQADSHMAAHREEKRSSEYELRHSEESSIPVRSSLTLTGPVLGASPPRKPLNSKTAAIIAAHSRPPAGLSLPGPFTTPGNSITRLLSSVTSLQSHVSGTSSYQGLTEGGSVLAGPKPSYANPTVAFTSKHRSPNVSASQGAIHPPSSSGDINAAGNRRERRSTSSSKRDPSASPPRRRGPDRSAHNTHNAQNIQRTVEEWAHVGERGSSGYRESGSGSVNRSAVVYPNGLSPEMTLELVHDLTGRSRIHEHHQHSELPGTRDRAHSERRERRENKREHRSLPPRDGDRVRSSV